MDDYPTDDDLAKITEWDAADPLGLVEYLRGLWTYPEYFKTSGKRVIRLELHTGGWSGNEDIITALGKTIFWSIFWEKSKRGGHYYFKIPSQWAIKAATK